MVEPWKAGVRVSYLLNGANWALSDPIGIPNLILLHLYITVVSVGIGFAIAFPIALLLVRFRRLYAPTISGADILYTIPSLALVAFLVPLTRFSSWTVIIPLVLYTQLVLIRNIVAAIHAVDPALVEVGRAMGMNTMQLQRRVVLPLALPIIIAGLRVVMVTTIGIATIGPVVAVQDIGYLIFQGVNTDYPDQTLAGTIIISALAIGADLGLLGLQSLLSRGRQLAPAS